ncbi:hypothetical protein SNEBB_011306 [Seison nebaliae]|nr:hypothetical protein SNEBB_011306 [Seison nebaliae]
MVEDTSSKAFTKVVKQSKIPKSRSDNTKHLEIKKPEDELDLKKFHQEKMLNRLSKTMRVKNTAKAFYNNKRANKFLSNKRLPHKFKTDFMKM